MDRPVSLETRQIELAIEPAFQLGRATVDPPAHAIAIGGQSARMQPQTLKVLVALHDCQGQVVSREQLIARCWSGRIVGDDVINRCISLLRRVSSQSGDFRIETVPRAGYRLIESSGGRPLKGLSRILISAVAALTITGVGIWSVQRENSRSAADVPTVAVMPLAEDSPGAPVHDFAAATRTSLSYAMGGYPVTLVDSRGRRTAPDLLVSGAVEHSLSSIRAFVEVEETRHGVVVYAHRFEADARSANALPDQIGASVAVSLARAATLMKLDRRHPSDPAITGPLLNALSFAGDADGPLQAYEIAREIAPKAPNSAIAQYSLASESANVLDDLPRDQRDGAIAAGRRASDRLLALTPDFGDAYGLWCSLHSPILIAECEDHLREGLRVDPDAAVISDALSALMNAVGRVDESLQLARVSLAKDPLNPLKLARVVRTLDSEGHTADAERLFRQSLRWWPNLRLLYWSRLIGMESRGDYPAIEAFAAEAGDLLPLDRETAAKAIGAVKAHDLSGLINACAAPGLRWTTQWLCLTALADLGDRDRAFAIAFRIFPPLRGRTAADEERLWLDQPAGFSISVLSSPAAAALRRDPRFLELAEGSGLVQYWRSGRLPDFCRTNPEPVCARLMHVQRSA